MTLLFLSRYMTDKNYIASNIYLRRVCQRVSLCVCVFYACQGVFMCVYLCVCMCQCACVCERVCWCACVYVYMCAAAFICICVCLSASLCVYLYLPVYVRVRLNVRWPRPLTFSRQDGSLILGRLGSVSLTFRKNKTKQNLYWLEHSSPK